MTPIKETSSKLNPHWSELVMAVAAGDAAGCERLYDVFTSLRYYFRTNVGFEHADDLFHDTVIDLIEQIQRGALRDPERLAGYARTIAVRKVHAQIAANISSRESTSIEEHEFRLRDHTPDPESNSIRSEEIAIMRRILDCLPWRDREVLIRFYLHEHSAERIQRDLNLTETQFRLIKSRAKARYHDLCRRRLSTRSWSAPARVSNDEDEKPDPHAGNTAVERRPARVACPHSTSQRTPFSGAA